MLKLDNLVHIASLFVHVCPSRDSFLNTCVAWTLSVTFSPFLTFQVWEVAVAIR